MDTMDFPRRITTGFVTQIYDPNTGLCVEQSFTRGDEEAWEDGVGDVVDEPANATFQRFDMVQPIGPMNLRSPIQPGRAEMYMEWLKLRQNWKQEFFMDGDTLHSSLPEDEFQKVLAILSHLWWCHSHAQKPQT